MRLPDLLDLVRIPNVVTAVSDIVAAWSLAYAVGNGGDLALAPLILTAVASAAFYTGGMALNDVADAQLDAQERPERPIPSGRLPRHQAAAVTLALLGSGLVLMALVGGMAFAVAAGLVAAIVLYDLVLAGRTWWGPLGMAACRGLNFSLGLVAAGGAGDAGWIAAALLFVYIVALTRLSLGEVHGAPRRRVTVTAATVATVGLSVGVLAWTYGGGFGGSRAIALGLVALAWSLRSGRPLVAAWRQPVPSRIGPAVGGLVGGILWLDASFTAAVAAQPWSWLAVFLILASVGELLRRRFPVT